MGDKVDLHPPHFRWNETFQIEVEVLPSERQALLIPVLASQDAARASNMAAAATQSTTTGSDVIALPHNITQEELEASMNLTLILGPKRQELYLVVPITLVYCLIFVTGIIGNVSTCIVIARNKYMQTATNYYLFNLAVADLLVLVLGLPQETYQFWSAYPWIFGNTFCVIRTMAAETSTYASILTITAFTVER